MTPRRLLVVALLAAVFASMGAQHRTTNFVVNAPNQEVAQQVGQWAEYYRKAKAVEWLGAALFTFSESRISSVWLLGDLVGLDARLRENQSST